MPDAVPAPTGPTAPALRFGPAGRFELRPAEYRLLVDGQPAALGGRALDLLIALAARPDRPADQERVARPRLARPGGRGRQPAGADQHLRKLLGDDVIATVPGAATASARRWLADAGSGSAAAAQPQEPAAAAVPAPRAAQRLFGRDADLARLEAAAAGVGGCVTLVGTPGVGKSSLARAATGPVVGPQRLGRPGPADARRPGGRRDRPRAGRQLDEGDAAAAAAAPAADATSRCCWCWTTPST